MKKGQAASVLTSILFIIFLLPHMLFASEWEPINVGRYSAISGIALIPEGTLGGAKENSGETNFLIVHDAKGMNVVTARIAMKGTRLTQYEALDWFKLKLDNEGKQVLDKEGNPIQEKTSQAEDLEALTALPLKDQKEPKFLAIQSDGEAYELEIMEHPVSIKNRCKDEEDKDKDSCKNSPPGPKSFFMVQVKALNWNLKTPEKGEIEGVAVQSIGKENLLIWGSRKGEENNKAAQFCWSNYPPSLIKNKFVQENKCETISEVPGFPKPKYCLGRCDRRYISDLKVDKEGRLYITSTITVDPDDNGPFDSVVGMAGKFSFDKGKFIFDSLGENRFKKVSDIFPHKIEALEFLPGKDTQFVLGADNENLGGFITFYKPENIEDTKFVILSPYIVKGKDPLKISLNNKCSLKDYDRIELSVLPTSLPKDSWWKSEEILKIDDIAGDVNSNTCEKLEDKKVILSLALDKFEYKDKKSQPLPDESMELDIQIQGIPKITDGNKDEKPKNLLSNTRKTIVYFKSPNDRKLHLVSPAVMITETKTKDGKTTYFASGGIRLILPLPEKKHNLFFKAYPGLESEAYIGNPKRIQLQLNSNSGNTDLLSPRFINFQPEYEFAVSASNLETKNFFDSIPIKVESYEEFKILLHYPKERNPEGIEVDRKLIIFKKREEKSLNNGS